MYAAQLEGIERFLAEALRGDAPLPERADLAAPLEAVIAGNDRLTPIERADIYREQFWLRHRDSLVADHPGLVHLIGDDAFDELVRAYLRACPPDSWTLRDLGLRLGDFAASYAFDAGVAGAARDMARYELAFNDVWDGPDAEAVSLADVQAVPPEAWAGARLCLHPAIGLIRLDHAVHLVRARLRAGETPERELPCVATHLVLFRSADLKVSYRSVSAPEYALLAALREGATLGDACDRAAAVADDPAALAPKLGGWFKRWAERGWIVGVER